MDHERLTYLLEQYHKQALTDAEQSELDAWYAAFDRKQDDLHLIYLQKKPEAVAEKIYQGIADRVGQPVRRKMIWRYAAVVTLLIGASIIFYLNRISLYDQLLAHTTKTVTAPVGKMRTVHLPDGSQVWLRAGSQLSYNRFMLGDERAITLHGEAFFEVEKDPNKPFVVYSDRYSTRVLGTSFNVKALTDLQVYEVAVRTGKVQVSDSGKVVANLLPDEAAIISEEEFYLARSISIDDHLSWRKGSLIFTHSSMAEIKWYLENYYGVEIGVGPDHFRECRFSGDFSGLSLRQVLEILQEVHPFDIQYTDAKQLSIVSTHRCSGS